MNFFTINLYSGLNTLQEGDNPSDDAVALRGLREIEGDRNIIERRGKQHALNEFKGHVRRENDAVRQKAGAFHAHGKSGAPRDDVHEPCAELWQKSVHGVEPAEGKVGIAGEFGAARMAEIVPQGEVEIVGTAARDNDLVRCAATFCGGGRDGAVSVVRELGAHGVEGLHAVVNRRVHERGAEAEGLAGRCGEGKERAREAAGERRFHVNADRLLPGGETERLAFHGAFGGLREEGCFFHEREEKAAQPGIAAHLRDAGFPVLADHLFILGSRIFFPAGHARQHVVTAHDEVDDISVDIADRIPEGAFARLKITH